MTKEDYLEEFIVTMSFNLKIKFKIKQSNISENINNQTLRGFHYQKFPHGEDKIITCLQGEVHNIVIDMRKNLKHL